MRVQDALRQPGGPGGVIELSRIVRGGVHGLEVRRGAGEQVVVQHDQVLDEVAIDPVGVVRVGDEHLRLRVGDAVADALVSVEHRHRQQDRARLPGTEEHGGRLGRRRQQHRDAVPALDTVVAQHVRALCREVLQLAPADRALVTPPVLPHHRELVARVLVADVGGDVVARRDVPPMLGAGLLVGARGRRRHGASICLQLRKFRSSRSSAAPGSPALRIRVSRISAVPPARPGRGGSGRGSATGRRRSGSTGAARRLVDGVGSTEHLFLGLAGQQSPRTPRARSSRARAAASRAGRDPRAGRRAPGARSGAPPRRCGGSRRRSRARSPPSSRPSR